MDELELLTVPAVTQAVTTEADHTTYELFKWSVLLKGAISLAEVLAAAILIAFPTALILTSVQSAGAWLTRFGGSTLLAHVTKELLAFNQGAILFVTLFLLSRGLIKCFLIWALLRNITWAYPWSLIVLALFVVYQLYEIITAHSVLVLGITLFDLVVMYFIWREWQIVTRTVRTV